MDRGIPTEETLQADAGSRPPPVPVCGGHAQGPVERVGGRAAETALAASPAQRARQTLSQDKELFVLVNSQARVSKERAIRRRKLKTLWARLKELKDQQAQLSNPADETGGRQSRRPAGSGRWWHVSLPKAPRTNKARQQRVAGFDVCAQQGQVAGRCSNGKAVMCCAPI